MTISANSQLAIQTIRAKAVGKDIVFVSGTFNIVHPGHLRLLRFAAECGDLLVVGVLSDRLASGAQLQETTRLDGVDAISLVSHVFSLDDAPADFISELQPSVVVMGNEHENANNPEQPVVQAYGGKLLFGSGGTTFSSLELLRRETEFIDHSSIIKTVEEDLVRIVIKAIKADIHVKDSFFTILGAGGGVNRHNHISALDLDSSLNLVNQKFSLVYYLSVGDQDCTEPGILKLYNPSENILPREGMIIIFPADRYHSVVYNGKKDRIIIGINFYSL